MAAKPKTTVHVMLDTNSLFTEAADKLLAQDIGEFIISSTENIELDVHWYLPSIVKAERRYQMLERAKRLIPHMQKVERLLGHQLGINEELLHTRVEEAIKRQVDIHDLKELQLDTILVDWQKIIEGSVLRKPPFDPGEGEKGFRDAIVLEVFCQLTATLPKTPQACRIVLLSNDDLLLSATRERTADRSNVVLVNDLQILKTMLNALAAELTQETVNSLLPKASSIFFEVDDQTTLYYKAAISQKIREQFGKELSVPPAPDFTVRTKIIRISSPPTFLTKSGQSLQFSSRIAYEMEATKLVTRLPNVAAWATLPPLSPSPTHQSASIADMLRTTNPNPLGINPSTLSIYPSDPSSYPNTFSISSTVPSHLAAPSPQVEEIKREGEHIFEATWTVTLTSKGALVNAKFLEVDYKSTKWKD